MAGHELNMCFSVASLCKELGFTAFGLFLVYDLITSTTADHSLDTRGLAKRSLLLCVFTAILALVRVRHNGEHRQMQWNILANSVANADDRLTRWLSYAHIHAWYLGKLLWPRWLSFDYGFNTIPHITSVLDPRNLFTAAAYSSVAIGLTLGFRSRAHSPLLVCIAFGAIPFVPASNVLFPVGTIVAERLLYFPSVGFCLLVGHIVSRALQVCHDAQTSTPNTDPKSQRVYRLASRLILVSSSLLLMGCWYRSQTRNADWKSDDALFEAALSVAPTNVKVLTNVGKTNLRQDPQRAIDILRVAISLLPQQINGHMNLGIGYWNRANASTSDALFTMRHLLKATAFDPAHIGVRGYSSAIFLHSLTD